MQASMQAEPHIPSSACWCQSPIIGHCFFWKKRLHRDSRLGLLKFILKCRRSPGLQSSLVYPRACFCRGAVAFGVERCRAASTPCFPSESL